MLVMGDGGVDRHASRDRPLCGGGHLREASDDRAESSQRQATLKKRQTSLKWKTTDQPSIQLSLCQRVKSYVVSAARSRERSPSAEQRPTRRRPGRSSAGLCCAALRSAVGGLGVAFHVLAAPRRCEGGELSRRPGLTRLSARGVCL